MVFFVRLLLLAFAVVGSNTALAAVPLSDFARHPQFRDVQISPQGDYLAATGVVKGHVVLSLIHLTDMKGINVRPRNGGEVSRFWWVSPNRVVYTISERFDVLEQPGETGEIYAVNVDGRDNDLMIGGRSSSDHYSADVVTPVRVIDNKLLVSVVHWNGSADGAYPVAMKLDIGRSAASLDVATAPIRNASFLADSRGEVRFAYASGTDLKQRVYYRSKAGVPWELVFDESKGDALVTPIDFARDDTHVYMTCEGAHGAGGLCSWDSATRKLTTSWSGDAAGLAGVVESFDRHDLVALRSEPGRPATTLIAKEAPESRLLVQLMQQFPGEDVRITSATPDGGKVVFIVSSGADPGRFFLYDAKEKKASLLLERMPWIKPAQMGVVDPFAFKARDGTALNGYVTRPAGSDSARGVPLVVFVHGGPYGVRDSWEFDSYVQMLASRGYAVLQVNYRGSGGYGDAFMKAGYREWGGKMQDDVTDATHWAIAQGIADPKRICIFGGSYGGYAALEGAVKEPDLYRCAIGYVGVYDLRLMYTRGDIPQSTFGDNYLKRVLGEDSDELWNRSPIAHIDRLKAKTMLIVGGQDWRVPPVHGESLHSALNKAHIEHEWLYQRTEGHGFYDEKNIEDMYAKVLAFLDRSIGDTAHSAN